MHNDSRQYTSSWESMFTGMMVSSLIRNSSVIRYEILMETL